MVCMFSAVCCAIVLFQFVKLVIPWIYKNFIAPYLFGPTIDIRKMGEWALVTGATEGIGKAYARQFAKRGLKLVLVGRNPEKLANVSKEMESQYNVKTKTIVVDFLEGPEIYQTIKDGIEGLEIGVLLNNVGMSYPYPEYFLQIPEGDKFIRDIISCNIHSLTHMTKMILPQMVERKKGVIINMSSMTGKMPEPLLTIYAATKAFIDKFTEDIGIEYQQHGVYVQSVMPGFVATNMSKIKKPSLMAPSAETYVNSSIKTIGIDKHTYGYIPHVFMKLSVDAGMFFLPEWKGYDICLGILTNLKNCAVKQLKKTTKAM